MIARKICQNLLLSITGESITRFALHTKPIKVFLTLFQCKTFCKFYKSTIFLYKKSSNFEGLKTLLVMIYFNKYIKCEAENYVSCTKSTRAHLDSLPYFSASLLIFLNLIFQLFLVPTLRVFSKMPF